MYHQININIIQCDMFPQRYRDVDNSVTQTISVRKETGVRLWTMTQNQCWWKAGQGILAGMSFCKGTDLWQQYGHSCRFRVAGRQCVPAKQQRKVGWGVVRWWKRWQPGQGVCTPSGNHQGCEGRVIRSHLRFKRITQGKQGRGQE